MDKTKATYLNLPIELSEFIDRSAKRREFHNKTHVVTTALLELQDKLEPEGE